MTEPADITTWSAEQLDELGVLAYSGVEGVELDEIGLGDEIPEHGVNAPREQVLPPPPEVT